MGMTHDDVVTLPSYDHIIKEVMLSLSLVCIVDRVFQTLGLVCVCEQMLRRSGAQVQRFASRRSMLGTLQPSTVLKASESNDPVIKRDRIIPSHTLDTIGNPSVPREPVVVSRPPDVIWQWYVKYLEPVLPLNGSVPVNVLGSYLCRAVRCEGIYTLPHERNPLYSTTAFELGDRAVRQYATKDSKRLLNLVDVLSELERFGFVRLSEGRQGRDLTNCDNVVSALYRGAAVTRLHCRSSLHTPGDCTEPPPLVFPRSLKDYHDHLHLHFVSSQVVAHDCGVCYDYAEEKLRLLAGSLPLQLPLFTFVCGDDQSSCFYVLPSTPFSSESVIYLKEGVQRKPSSVFRCPKGMSQHRWGAASFDCAGNAITFHPTPANISSTSGCLSCSDPDTVSTSGAVVNCLRFQSRERNKDCIATLLTETLT